LAAPPSSACRLDADEAGLGDVAGAELDDVAGVEVEVDDDEDELHPATSAARASAEPAVIICLGFTFFLPFRIESERDSSR
jgi:hypothetical protein